MIFGLTLLGGYLLQLQKVKGYKASAVMTFRGEILASHSTDDGVDLFEAGQIFNDIFRNAHEASDMIGLLDCRETVINIDRGIFAMRCSGVEAQLHFHLLVIIAADGNLALAKLELEKLVPCILAELS